MNSITLHTVLTVFMMISFITLVIWVMSGRQKKAYDEASLIPLMDDLDIKTTTSSNGSNNHE